MAESQGKPSILKCRRFWTRGVSVCLAILTVGFAISLPFGNCQWTRLHWLFQVYVYPDYATKYNIYIRPCHKYPFEPSSGYTGTWRTYYRTGQVCKEARYLAGKRHGRCVVWNRDGTENRSYEYANGQLHGLALHFEKHLGNGEPPGRLEQVYRRGKLHGLETMWHSNGRKASEGLYVDGEPNGAHRCWYSTGQPRSLDYYRKGVVHGVCIEWDKRGSMDIAFYLNGAEVTRQAYLAVCAKDPTLPRPPREPGQP